MRPIRDIIADHLSSVIPPSRSAFNRADNLIRALEDDGYRIVHRENDCDLPRMQEVIDKTRADIRRASRP